MAAQLIRDILDGQPIFEGCDELDKKYRKLARVIHPDKCSLDGATEAFQALRSLYEQKARKPRIDEDPLEVLLIRQRDAQQVSEALQALRRERAQEAAQRAAERRAEREGWKGYKKAEDER